MFLRDPRREDDDDADLAAKEVGRVRRRGRDQGRAGDIGIVACFLPAADVGHVQTDPEGGNMGMELRIR